MAQAYALATGSSYAFGHELAQVVQTPLRPSYSNCTTSGVSLLAEATTTSLLEELTRRGGDLNDDTEAGLADLVAAMVAMAEGTATPSFYLSSLDPGVGKTTTLIHFVRALMGSYQHKGVAVLLCFFRLEEIAQLVEGMGLSEADFAVFTGKDNEINGLSSTPPSEARILFTTQSMVKSRCRSRSFSDAEVFHYQGEVRAVRIWDEAMLRGETISISTDQLAALRDPLRTSHPSLVELVTGLEHELEQAQVPCTFTWPDVEEDTGVNQWSARLGLKHRHAGYLDTLYALSGRRVLLRKPSNTSPVITALDSRDAIPDDLAPVVILDASGRVRSTYSQWEKAQGNLVRLKPASKSYRNLTVHVMDTGSGKTAWLKNGEALAQEVAQMINSKPEEPWLVIYHKGVKGGTIPDQIRGLLSSNPDRVSFLNWGKHQGTNEFRHIQNVILAGLNNHPETDYEMKARYYSGIPNDQAVSKTLVDQMRTGEHKHHVLQALCRSGVRQGSSSECGPYNAYIIAPKRSGIRGFLPEVFPGCRVGTWRPIKKKSTGKVHDALLYVEMHFEDYPDEVLLLRSLRDELGITDPSNFRNSIRYHESFQPALERLGVQEVVSGKGRTKNALAKKPAVFGPVSSSTYIADV